MGTINEKISYLAETKQRQKNLINALGGEITNETPFREYENELIGVLPKVTGEGTNFSLSPTIEYDLEVESLLGDTVQEGTPTPETPIPIQVVTGTQEIEVVGKNIFDKTTVTRNTTFTSQNVTSTSEGLYVSDYIKVKPSTTYYVNQYCSVVIGLDKDKTSLGYIRNTSNGGSFTTATNCEYVRVRLYATSIDMETAINNAQLELGSTATTYSPYTSESYTLHLGDEELAKIGDYQDKIYFDNGKWYKKSQITKYTFIGDGIEQWYRGGSGINRYYLEKIGGVTFNNIQDLGLSNYYTLGQFANRNNTNEDNKLFVGTSSIQFRKDDITTERNWRDWLSEHNTTVYYVLANATTTEITNTTLLQDLNYIKEHIKSYSDTTNITSSGDLSIVISASAIKQLS